MGCFHGFGCHGPYSPSFYVLYNQGKCSTPIGWELSQLKMAKYSLWRHNTYHR